jgi:nitrite reductase/ring-hydroxylating ferredoxin subunit
MNETTNLVELCGVADVTPDAPFKAQVGGTEVAVFLVGDAYYVTQDLCTHGPGSLCEGFVEGDEIECPFHQGKFSIITGAPTAAPCTEPLKIWTVTVQDDKIFVPQEPVA